MADEGSRGASNPVAQLLATARFTPLHRRVWLLAAMGILLDGFDFFIMGVAIPLLKEDFDLSALEAGLVSGAAVVGAIFGATCFGRLTDRLGRALVFKIDLAMFVVFALLSALAWDVWSLIAFRFLLGVGVGADYPISAGYVAEIAPDRLRSRLLVGTFSFQAAGQLLGAVVGVIVLNLWPEVGSWRIMLAFGVLPALVIVLMRRGTPESPLWLESQGRTEEAADVASRFLEREIAPEDVRGLGDQPPKVPYRALFAARFRRRTTLTTIPWFLMDIATYGVGVFTPTIIAALAIQGDGTFISDDIASAEGAAVVDIFLVVGFALAYLLITRVRHTRLQASGFAGMIVGLSLLAFTSGLEGGGDDNLVLVFIGFAIFNIFMNAGPNTTTYVLPAEIFPTDMRASGHGLAAAAGKTGAALGLIFFPVMQDDLGLPTTLLIIAGGCLVALVITLVFAVEPGRDEPTASRRPTPARP